MSAHPCLCLLMAVVIALFSTGGAAADESLAAIGSNKPIGCRESPERKKRLVINIGGVYENLLIDGEWSAGTLVDIRADDVVLRNCEIRNAAGNGVVVSGRNVVIDSCKIHHCLAGSAIRPAAAHGLTGHPQKLTVHNCEIFHVSGSAVFFGPSSKDWDDVTIENCTFWSSPLPDAAAKFLQGERPGTSGVKAEMDDAEQRGRMFIRDSLFHGWMGQGEFATALNFGGHVEVVVENCVFRGNDVGIRVRGGAHNPLVEITDCAVYKSPTAVRLEDAVRDVAIRNLATGRDVATTVAEINMRGERYVNENPTAAPGYERALRTGLRTEGSSPFERSLSAAPISEPPPAPQPETTWRAYLPGGGWRVVLAFAIVIVMPFLGLMIYIAASGRRKMVGKVLEEAVRRMLSR